MQHIFTNAYDNYTAMNNHFLEDENLSSSAKGVLAVILSNKEDWKIYPEDIAKRSKDGLASHRTAFKELEKHGYIRTITKSLGRGKGVRRYRFAQDVPITDAYFESIKERLEQELSTDLSTDPVDNPVDKCFTTCDFTRLNFSTL
ncbi:helix-turn-helix domain-containing protein [Streptococcus sciuri]|uniref:Helix-turn-helix domain-containing protein n=1 Tax=Streptococcus sciuri TaxID=2973939 RepID=A0ABT2F7M0_9STRE|nr:helix-turn-helix domain-containing protein [Streptococcus sciuri]MCS4488414.1 helix-turn-helix domain-containing protein [Streptococcus sciuri]